jgi:hypothetical protein
MRNHLLLGAAVAAALPLFVLLVIALSAEDTPVPSKPETPQIRVDVQPAAKPSVPTPPVTREKFTLPPAHYWGREATIGEFTVCAVNRHWAGPASEVVTLDHAVDSGQCIIRESGRRGFVTAEVSGNRPVLGLVGDLLFGGKQDRLIARSVVLEPGFSAVPVFTAETWQWPAGPEPEEKVMARDDSSPQVDLNVRAAIYQTGSQAHVTAAIMQIARELEVPDANGRGAYRGTFNTPRAAAIDEMVSGARRIVWAFTVGFVVYHGDKLIAADLFESTWLLESSTDKLLRSYAMTAVYGDVSSWVVEPPPAPEPLPELIVPEPPSYRTPFNYEPPKAAIVIDDEDLIRRECRRSETGKPIHIGLFRRSSR